MSLERAHYGKPSWPKLIKTILTNFSRHDLRPLASATANTENIASTTGEGSELPPPLVVEGAETAETGNGSNRQRRRVSRLLDLNRLRHAPPDERIDALRQL